MIAMFITCSLQWSWTTMKADLSQWRMSLKFWCIAYAENLLIQQSNWIIVPLLRNSYDNLKLGSWSDVTSVGNGIMAVVLEYLKRKVIEWRFTNANFVLNITLLLHFTMKVRGIWCVLLIIYKHFCRWFITWNCQWSHITTRGTITCSLGSKK